MDLIGSFVEPSNELLAVLSSACDFRASIDDAPIAASSSRELKTASPDFTACRITAPNATGASAQRAPMPRTRLDHWGVVLPIDIVFDFHGRFTHHQFSSSFVILRINPDEEFVIFKNKS